MGKEQVQNYLDIQLRDMDYLKTYGSNLRGAFLDPANWYDTDGYFEEDASLESEFGSFFGNDGEADDEFDLDDADDFGGYDDEE